MTMLDKWAFKRLVDELSLEQYQGVIRSLREAEVPFPGWTDRLAPERKVDVPAESLCAVVPLPALSRALMLTDTATRLQYMADGKDGVWLQAAERSLRLTGSDDYCAAFATVEALVNVPGTVVVPQRDLWQIVEALRKGLSRKEQATASARLETVGTGLLRIQVGNRWHQVSLIGSRKTSLEIPPRPEELFQVATGEALKRSVLMVVQAAASEGRYGSGETDAHFVGVQIADGGLNLDASTKYSAANAHLPATGDGVLELLVHYLWLRKVGAAIGAEPVRMGVVTVSEARQLFMIEGKGWAAWTSATAPWRERFQPKTHDDHVAATFLPTGIAAYLREALRLAGATFGGPNRSHVEVTIGDGELLLRSADSLYGPSVGAFRVPAEISSDETVVTHLSFDSLTNAFKALSGVERVTLHVRPLPRTVAYLSTTDRRPGSRPKAIWTLAAIKPVADRH